MKAAEYKRRRGYDPAAFDVAPMGGPEVHHFPVVIPPGFAPTDIDKDGADLSSSGRTCPGQDPEDGYRPRWGGGFYAARGKHLHAAVDIMAAEGALVVAMSHWTIPETVRVGRQRRPGVGESPKGGLYFFARDDLGYEWYGSHCSWLSPAAVPGAVFFPGEVIAKVGRTGNASRDYGRGPRGCPHLHLRLGYVLQSGAVRKYDCVPLLRPLYEQGMWKAERSGIDLKG